MTDNELTKDIEIRPSSILLWISNLSGAFAFAVDMQSRFALVQWACFNHREWTLHVISATAFIAAVDGAWLGWAAFTRLGANAERARFMGLSGFILSGFFALSIIANALPHLFLRPCD